MIIVPRNLHPVCLCRFVHVHIRRCLYINMCSAFMSRACVRACVHRRAPPHMRQPPLPSRIIIRADYYYFSRGDLFIHLIICEPLPSRRGRECLFPLSFHSSTIFMKTMASGSRGGEGWGGQGNYEFYDYFMIQPRSI